MSPPSALTSQFFLEASSPRKGQRKRPLRGDGLRIMQQLRPVFPQPMTPKEIRTVVPGVSYESVKKWLQRNEGQHVVKVAHGWYRARADAQLLRKLGIEPLKVHAIQALLKSRDGGLPPALEGLGSPRTTKDGQAIRVAEYEGRVVTVQAGGMVSVRASKDPFSVPEFGRLAAWLEGLTGGGSCELQGFDLNVDVDEHRLRMGGMKTLSLGGFAHGLLKIYDKQERQATRIEACVHGVKLDVQEAAAIIGQLSSPPEWYAPPDTFEGVV